jgi:hypothetical protein
MRAEDLELLSKQVALFTKCFERRLMPFVSEVIGTVSVVDCDLAMLKQDVLECFLDLLRSTTMADHFCLFTSTGEFNPHLFLGTLDYLARVVTEAASQNAKLLAITSMVNILQAHFGLQDKSSMSLSNEIRTQLGIPERPLCLITSYEQNSQLQESIKTWAVKLPFVPSC